MTDYIEILEAETDPEAPSTSSLWKRWAKNWIAGFEGGAPHKVQTNALGVDCVVNSKVLDGTLGAEKFQSGSAEMAWVGDMFAGVEAGGVGSFAMLIQAASSLSTYIVQGQIYSGASFRFISRYHQSGGDVVISGGTPLGSWQAMGGNSFYNGTTMQRTAQFKRVA